MQQISQPYALRVGLIGTLPTPALPTTLARLSAALPHNAAGPPLLRLLHAQDQAAAVPEGWTSHPIEGDLIADKPAIIVRNADVVIAAGPDAEVADTVDLALGLGIPVLRLPETGTWHLLTDRFWRVSRNLPIEGDAAWAALRDRLTALLTPPPGEAPTSLQAVEADRRLPARLVWRAHRTALELLSRTRPGTHTAEAPLAWWSTLYAPADALANAYADRYRSSYTIVLALAATALIAAVLGLRSEDHWLFALPEAVCLLAIIGLVWANTALDWRSRLIQCRLLAELCRKQAALAFLGRSLPAARIADLTRDGELSWIGWRFAAAVRSAPLPTTTLAGAPLAAATEAAAAVLLHGQHAYHEARVAAGRNREKTLVRAGEIVFAITVLLVMVKLGLLLAHNDHEAEHAGLAAALLPAIAAALFGFRAYAELELLVQHSERLIAVLEEAKSNLAIIDPARPGASQQIGDVLDDTAVEMLADVAGWIQISRVKAVEAG